MPTRIFLVRHGQSTFNAAKRFQGCCDDSVLTTGGRLAAYQTGLALNHTNFDAVYVSPLQRAQETAHEMMSAIGAFFNAVPPVHTHSDLQEIHLPEWQGLSYQEVRSRFADAYQQWQNAPHLFQMQLPQPLSYQAERTTLTTLTTGDTPFLPLQQLYTQAKRFWQDILVKHQHQTVLVISHGGTIRALMSTAIGLKLQQFHHLQQSNTGINELVFDHPQHLAKLHSLNLTSHLGEVLPKLKNGKQGLRLLLLPINDFSGNANSLIPQLQSIPLDFCVTDASDRAQSVATQILRQHPNTHMQLPISQSDFLLNWHQAIQRRIKSQTGLSTILVITQVEQIQTFLHHILEQPQAQHPIVVKPETLTVLYYPASTHHPVLQAINLSPDRIDS